MYLELRQNIGRFLISDNKASKKQQEENNNQLYDMIKAVYIEEFKDFLKNILKETNSVFLNGFSIKMHKFLRTILPSDAWANETISNSMNKIENDTIVNEYKNTLSLLKSSYNQAMLNWKEKDAFCTFIKHCDNNLIALHVCGDFFIPVTDPNTKKIEYVICKKCKEVYDSSCILMKCESCEENFYTAYMSKSDMKTPPATWESYHCDIVMNEQMHCIRCNDLFWLKDEQLYCKSCKFMIDPLDVVWKCIRCTKEFKSRAVPYNPLSFKIVKMCVKYAWINRNYVKPVEMGCECKMDSVDVDFRHNDKCDGVMFLGYLNGKDVVVCSKCGNFCSVKKFDWRCPTCKKTFKTKKACVVLYDEDYEAGEKKELTNEDEKQEKEESNIQGKGKKRKIRKLSIHLGDDLLVEEEKKKSSDKPKKEAPKIMTKIDYISEKERKKNEFEIKIKTSEEEKEKIIKGEKNKIKSINEKNKENDYNPSLMKKLNKLSSKTITKNIEDKEQDIISDNYEKIDFTKEDLTIVKSINEIQSEVKLKENEYTLSSIDESNELNNYIKLNNKDSLFIYGTLKNEELPNKIQILTEKITNSLTEDVKDNNSPYEEQTLFTLIKNSLHFLKDYSKTEPNFIVSSDNFYKLSTREQFKVFPFSLSLENNEYKVIGYKDIVLSLGIMTLYAAIKDKKITEEIKAKINQREKEEVLKLIYSNLRGKYSEGLIDLIRKMCETDKGKKLSIDDLSTLFEE